jgi:hypothetical protein
MFSINIYYHSGISRAQRSALKAKRNFKKYELSSSPLTQPYNWSRVVPLTLSFPLSSLMELSLSNLLLFFFLFLAKESSISLLGRFSVLFSANKASRASLSISFFFFFFGTFFCFVSRVESELLESKRKEYYVFLIINEELGDRGA